MRPGKPQFARFFQRNNPIFGVTVCANESRDLMPVKIDPTLHQEKKPPWIRVRLPNNPVFWDTKGLIDDLNLVTVCEEAQCPNRWEC